MPQVCTNYWIQTNENHLRSSTIICRHSFDCFSVLRTTTNLLLGVQAQSVRGFCNRDRNRYVHTKMYCIYVFDTWFLLSILSVFYWRTWLLSIHIQTILLEPLINHEGLCQCGCSRDILSVLLQFIGWINALDPTEILRRRFWIAAL